MVIKNWARRGRLLKTILWVFLTRALCPAPPRLGPSPPLQTKPPLRPSPPQKRKTKSCSKSPFSFHNLFIKITVWTKNDKQKQSERSPSKKRKTKSCSKFAFSFHNLFIKITGWIKNVKQLNLIAPEGSCSSSNESKLAGRDDPSF